MRITNRVKKLEAAVPKCDGRVTRIARPGEVLTEDDRRRICGGCHVLVIKRVSCFPKVCPLVGLKVVGELSSP